MKAITQEFKIPVDHDGTIWTKGTKAIWTTSIYLN